MQPDPRDNFKKDRKLTFGNWLWTCFKICIILIAIPFVIGAIACIAAVFLPVLFIAVPIAFIAFLWLLLT